MQSNICPFPCLTGFRCHFLQECLEARSSSVRELGPLWKKLWRLFVGAKVTFIDGWLVPVCRNPKKQRETHWVHIYGSVQRLAVICTSTCLEIGKRRTRATMFCCFFTICSAITRFTLSAPGLFSVCLRQHTQVKN